MKNKQIAAITLVSAAAAGIAFYFWKKKAGRIAGDNLLKATSEHGEVQKRVHQVKSPIRKYLRKAKTAVA